MKRAKHSLSHYRLFTGDMGKLIPIGCFEALPGDSIQQATSCLIRMSPLVAPVMHPVVVRVHHWFVPFRIMWDGWEDFITGGSDGLGNGAGTPPVTNTGPGGVATGSLMDYLGIPVGLQNVEVLAFPLYAYNMIYNEFYRDQDLVGEVNLANNVPLPVAWEKDYFTSARPWPQKGPDVVLPLGDVAPVRGIGTNSNVYGGQVTGVYETDRSTPTTYPSAQTDAGQNWVIQQQGTTGFPYIYADLSAATGASVNDLRLALALQRYQEARAMYGSRYTEYLRYLGVRSSDARLQRPEYLGGGKQTISFSEVLKTGSQDDPTEPIGTMKGHGIAALRSRRYRRFFEEHGVVLSLMSVRPRSMYTDGLHKLWLRRSKEDYWQKELELIGQQEVDNREVWASGTPGVFGYQDRYAEYRHIPSTVHGEFRDVLNYWHLGRSFSAQPVLNEDFVNCDPGKRIFAEQTQHSMWVMCSHSIQARRLVGRSRLPRIL